MEVGLFFKGDEDGPNPTTNLSLNDDVNNTNPSGRIYHDDATVTDGTAVTVTPARLGYINTTASTYYLPLPATPPARGETADGKWSEGFFAVAWYDTDGDGALDLQDGPVTSHAAQGEYNRMATKTVSVGGTDTLVYLDFVERSETVAEDYQFKYYQVGNDSVYGHIQLSDTNNEDFDFAIDATTDTN